jgi:hypothetical protein
MRSVRIASAVGLVSAALIVGLAVQASGAGTGSERADVVRVVGYSRVALTGSPGPVSAEVRGRKAVAILAAYTGLSVSSSGPFCVEALSSFSITVLPPGSAKPIFTATEYDCPSPGIVAVIQHSRIRYLKEDCAFRNAVIAALPAGEAEGTRHDSFAHCAAK